ncbi:Putative short-chain type dehydrogenase/reductase/MSMEI_5872 [Mycobacterium pseudokansasii]|uniref:Short-chain type dehydrogenase/reductase/MSMEI_5872 n=1 Tax=Mycobacterium pseudokansasii TaxID=2341080 RepID=A0A498QVR8_9MYCO|nr:Putative short-chain type dehydrogenase/reductase/MSMEI_5872 [Mycobacterium pseudokansasii]VBA31370.1 Putative short-chain type dehydrogenase/reductase/MSMEI_5872 [Mycobacterium pseudokansasii]VBA54037.1 Putative short-chain type dehydrogenase/reductase/MSMEI_5872 [Mycobacterium pseudokansasii]
MQFDGKVAFITGAPRGQGRSHAVRFAEEGADIIAVDLCEQMDSVACPMATREDLDETVHLVEKTGRRIVAEQVDVRNFRRLQAVVDKGVSELGRLDFVLANAGLRRWRPRLPRKSTRIWMRWTCCSTGCISRSKQRCHAAPSLSTTALEVSRRITASLGPGVAPEVAAPCT